MGTFSGNINRKFREFREPLNRDNPERSSRKRERAKTIPTGSTLQADGRGSAEQPKG